MLAVTGLSENAGDGEKNPVPTVGQAQKGQYCDEAAGKHDQCIECHAASI